MTLLKMGLLAGMLSSMTAQAALISYALPSGPIADNSTTPFAFNISDDYTIDDLDISLSLEHSWVGDLVIVLTGPGPNPAIVKLMDRPGSPSPFLIGRNADLSQIYPLIFDDEASVLAEDIGSGCAATTHIVGLNCQVGVSFKPDEFLSLFDGKSAKGDWLLSITDSSSLDVGFLRGGTLRVTTNDVVTIPEPAALALLGLGLIGMVAIRRKKVA